MKKLFSILYTGLLLTACSHPPQEAAPLNPDQTISFFTAPGKTQCTPEKTFTTSQNVSATIQFCYTQPEKLFSFNSYFVLLNGKEILRGDDDEVDDRIAPAGLTYDSGDIDIKLACTIQSVTETMASGMQIPIETGRTCNISSDDNLLLCASIYWQ